MENFKIKSDILESLDSRIKDYQKQVSQHHSELHDPDSPLTGWVDLPMDDGPVDLILDIAKDIQEQFDALVVVGIGGSYLGARACYEALCSNPKVRLFFAGWNLSSSYHRRLLSELDHHNVAVAVISKSGSTMETMVAFEVLKDYLKTTYGSGWKGRVYAVTDDKPDNELKAQAEAEGYNLILTDSSIGSRYSVLSEIGLLPLAAAGVDVRALMEGAALAYEDTVTDDLSDNMAYRYAAFRNLMFQRERYVELFSFTDPEMRGFGDWLRQLFAESEGKDDKGIYPTVLTYSTDLHSIGQYIQDGKKFFFETLIDVAEYPDDITIPGESQTYNDRIRAAAEAVYSVRNAGGTPISEFTLRTLDAKSLGYLIYFFEKACAMSCLLMGVNPFDQPGVDAYKQAHRHLLTHPKT